MMTRAAKVLRDPLLHFLGAGLALFLGLTVIAPEETEDRIVVDREALVGFVQYRSKAFEPDVAASMLDQMNVEDLRRLTDDYIREEALYREAVKLGFQESDYVIRQRMVQKLEFMAETAASPATPDDAEVAAYFDAHKSDYAIPSGATFTHVFISPDGKDKTALAHAAREMLTQLRAEQASFEDATRYGDRFLFHTNYVERTRAYIHSQLGDKATDTIFAVETPLNEWVGPVYSTHGAHLLYITARTPLRLPSLSEIETTIKEDMMRAKKRAQTDEFINDIVNNYSVSNKLAQPTTRTKQNKP